MVERKVYYSVAEMELLKGGHWAGRKANLLVS